MTALSGLSAFTVTKNALSLDYCIVEMINSVLPIADEVVVGDMGSDDGTREMLDEWAARESRLRVVRIYDWTLERANPRWFTNALNRTREELRYSMMIELDADEILSDDPDTYAAIKRACQKTNAIAIDRLNFCRDPFSLIPEGECVGRWVVRCGPSHLFLPSDEPYPRGTIHLLDMAHIEPAAKIFHMGFLRKPTAFYAKARVVLGAFFGNYDQRLVDAEAAGVNPMSGMEWYNRLVSYTGTHPEAVKQWCRARGYDL